MDRSTTFYLHLAGGVYDSTKFCPAMESSQHWKPMNQGVHIILPIRKADGSQIGYPIHVWHKPISYIVYPHIIYIESKMFHPIASWYPYNLAGGFNPQRKNWEMLGSSHQIGLKTETNHRPKIHGPSTAPKSTALHCQQRQRPRRQRWQPAAQQGERHLQIASLGPDEPWIVVGSTGRIPSSWFGCIGKPKPHRYSLGHAWDDSEKTLKRGTYMNFHPVQLYIHSRHFKGEI